MLNDIILEELGSKLIRIATWAYMKTTYLMNTSAVNDNLFKGQRMYTDQIEDMFYDMVYGLNEVQNFEQWDALTFEADYVERIQMINHLRFNYGLYQEQIDECIQNWNMMFQEGQAFVLKGLLSED